MKRLEQITLIVSFIGFCWLGMQVVHELGHFLAGILTGADGIQVYLHPCIISRTDVRVNPHPGIVVWAGPLVGVLFPFLVYGIAKFSKSPGLYLYRFFAGFCLITNGVYIAFGPGGSNADSGVMLAYGSTRWIMALFGLLTIPLGLYFWHRLGPHFGLGQAKGKVNRNAVIVSAVLLITIVTTELILNSR